METKISFGFKKLAKKPTIIGAKPPEVKKVELIECLDDQSIKIKGHVEEEEKQLVIPMQGASKNLLDRIKEANELKERSRIKYTKKPEKNGLSEDTRPDSELTIAELAARRLIEEAKNYGKKISASKVMTIAIEDQLILEGAQEPTMDDYDNVPISDYGYAMLRGMGWKEEQTVGKQKVEASSLRPKGMGLGASVPGNQTNKIPVDKNGKELKLVKNAKAKIIAGKEKGNYCIVQGLDEDASRVIVKTTITGTVLSFNEFMLFPVSDEEYIKSAKVLNNAKFEKYSKIHKDKQNKIEHKEENGEIEYVPNKSDVKIELSSDSEEENEKYEGKSSKHKNESSDDKKQRIKQERRSRSSSNSSLKDKNRKQSSSSKHSSSRTRRNRSRSRSTSRIKLRSRKHSSASPPVTVTSNDSNYKTNNSRKTGSRHERTRSRSKSPSGSRNRSKSNRKKYETESESSADDEQRRHKKTKSKKHKKEKKKHKHKKKSKRHSFNSDNNSS